MEFQERSQKGFTLIELLVVLSLLACLAASGMPVSMNMYREYLFNTEYLNIVRLLTCARAESINNFNQTSHGIRFEAGKYISFEGNYDSASQTNQIFNQNSAQYSGAPVEIIFAPYTGGLEKAQTIELTDGINTKTISINQMGRIDFE